MMNFRSLLLLASLFALASCSTGHFQTGGITETVVDRSIARAYDGIAFPANASFDLREQQGLTYISFLRSKVKPALDRLSDAKNGGGGGFENIGSAAFQSQAQYLDPKTLSEYKGAKWDRASKTYKGEMADSVVITAFDTLKRVRPRSTVDSLTYFSRDDKQWPAKNDMAVALKEAKINAAPFDLATLYALTGGIGVKVRVDARNTNYHVLYKTGHTNPDEEVMSGRSFAASPEHGAADATDPEYLRDLQRLLSSMQDQRPFYRALVLTLAGCDASGWSLLPGLGQSVLSDFLTVYTAEADRHLMVNLQRGNHPWEIDLAAVTFVSSISVELGKIVVEGVLQDGDLGRWFAPSPHNVEGGPRRSGIGITRKDRQKFQRAIHAFEMNTAQGKKLIDEIQSIIGTRSNRNDVIQGVFEFLSSPSTPDRLGAGAARLADLMAEFIALARHDAREIAGVVATVQ